eukprot:m.4999 g.4999  ORF g.4999 m.4999 type:complete len:114 (+) comp7356_c0_seq1:72-413(+)
MSYGGYGGSSSSNSYGGPSGNYGSDFNSPSSGSMSASQRTQVMSQVQQQVQMSQFTELLQKMSHACFEKCVPKPGTSLSSSEQACIGKCADRFVEAMSMVSRTYIAKLQQSQR